MKTIPEKQRATKGWQSFDQFMREMGKPHVADQEMCPCGFAARVMQGSLLRIGGYGEHQKMKQ